MQIILLRDEVISYIYIYSNFYTDLASVTSDFSQRFNTNMVKIDILGELDVLV